MLIKTLLKMNTRTKTHLQLRIILAKQMLCTQIR